MQRKVIHTLLQGDDALYIAPTGLGKSLCYQLPAVMQERGKTAVITTPLIALMRDQVRKLQELEIPATDFHSDMTRNRERVLEEIQRGKYAMVYMSPEQLQKADVIESLRSTNRSFMAIDEAHCISQWGHDFRPAYGALGKAVKHCGFEQVGAFTATASPIVEQDIRRTLAIPKENHHRENPLRKNLQYGVTKLDTRHQKIDAIEKLIKEHAPGKNDAVIVYCGTRNDTDHIASMLRFRGMGAQFYHGEMAGSMRRDTEKKFMGDTPRVLAATNAFGMGIDKPNIRLVIHNQFPSSVQNYLQETGRAGRDGKPSRCELLYCPQDSELQEYFLERKVPPYMFIRGVYLNLVEASQKRSMRAEGYFSIDLFPFYRLFDRKGKWDIEKNELRVNSAFSILEQAGIIERPSPSVFRIAGALDENETGQQLVKGMRNQRESVGRFHLDQMLTYATSPKPSQQQLIKMLGQNAPNGQTK